MKNLKLLIFLMLSIGSINYSLAGENTFNSCKDHMNNQFDSLQDYENRCIHRVTKEQCSQMENCTINIGDCSQLGEDGYVVCKLKQVITETPPLISVCGYLVTYNKDCSLRYGVYKTIEFARID